MVKILAVISPAKTLDFESDAPVSSRTDYRFGDQAQGLIEELKTKTVHDLQSMMKLSENLAQLNVDRFQNWQPVMTKANSKQALFAFKGDVYTGLNAETLTKRQITAAQSHLRILSGLYGLLRPLDAIQPYRLEMGTKVETSRGANLYQYWGDSITQVLNEDLKDSSADILLNLASIEYFKAVNVKKLERPILTPIFKEKKNGEYKVISFFAKKARGLMVRYLLDEKPKSLAALKAFNYGGYQFCKTESDTWNWVFKREQ